jgi:hypothetical protein
MAGVKTQLDGIEKKLDSLIQSFENTCQFVNKHEVELYGETASKDKIGIVRTIDGLKNSLDRFKSIYATAIGAISIVASAVITAVINFIFRRHGV